MERCDKCMFTFLLKSGAKCLIECMIRGCTAHKYLRRRDADGQCMRVCIEEF